MQNIEVVGYHYNQLLVIIGAIMVIFGAIALFTFKLYGKSKAQVK